MTAAARHRPLLQLRRPDLGDRLFRATTPEPAAMLPMAETLVSCRSPLP
jgi:hypothetical protein